MQIGQLLGKAVQHNPNLQQPLTAEQKSALEQILAQFNSATFNQSDAKALGNALKEAGIRPSAEVRAAIEAKGINISQFAPAPQGKDAPPPPPPPPPPTAKNSSDEDTTLEALLKAIADFLEKIQSGNATQEDTQQLAELAQQVSSEGSGLIVDQVA